jgi:hypothetical protein
MCPPTNAHGNHSIRSFFHPYETARPLIKK